MTAAEYKRLHARRPAKGRANRLTKAILNWLTLQGHTAWRQNNIPVPLPDGKGFRAGSVLKGMPDILGFRKGDARLIAIEVKAGRDTLRPAQAELLGTWNKRGAIVLVARSLDDVLKHPALCLNPKK